MNHFQTDLEWSHSQSDSPMWESIYREAFPDFDGMRSVLQDGWAQRAGIDRQVLLSGGRVLNIDEKARRKDWPDILIEFFSDIEKRREGWIAKSLAIDYLAYAFVPSQTCYLLPFNTLRRAWKGNALEWVALGRAKREGFNVVKAPNQGYTTVSVAVPIPRLLDAVRDAMIVNFP